MKAA
jgi:myosin heavy subunit